MASEAASGVLTTGKPTLNPAEVREQYLAVRRMTEEICEPLEVEDFCIQSMPDASPTKWHLAHTSWFFETFVLQHADEDYRSPDPQYAVLFNSYYHAVGEQHARPARGLLSRPTVAEVMNYRSHVDRSMESLLSDKNGGEPDLELLAVIETGIHHEQQHQELMLMDIKHAFFQNPLRPGYCNLPEADEVNVPPLNWIPYEGQVHWIGHDGTGFAFDNELPRHRTFVESFLIADRLITCGEYLSFIEGGGYERPELWLSDGWDTVQARNWHAPLYWEREGAGWKIMTMGGMRDLDPGEPVSHVSYYEADAFARWRNCWLPRESAWESVAAAGFRPADGRFLENGHFKPLASTPRKQSQQPSQLFGDLWEWTCSPYSPYPGYRAPEGALGEYNGKFMCNQMVLRGGSFGTPRSHIRATYRNFFPPDARWPFTGLRLAREFA